MPLTETTTTIIMAKQIQQKGKFLRGKFSNNKYLLETL